MARVFFLLSTLDLPARQFNRNCRGIVLAFLSPLPTGIVLIAGSL
jgi:hypothetical protein